MSNENPETRIRQMIKDADARYQDGKPAPILRLPQHAIAAYRKWAEDRRIVVPYRDIPGAINFDGTAILPEE